jgi:DNA gyrase subunit A
MKITDKTGKLIAIKSVTDDNDLMIINKSGITIRLAVSNLRVMGRTTQGVRLINLDKKVDEIASVTKVASEKEEEKPVNELNSEDDLIEKKVVLSEDEIVEEEDIIEEEMNDEEEIEDNDEELEDDNDMDEEDLDEDNN